MRHDARGLAVSLADATTVDAVDRFTEHFLASRPGTGGLPEAAERAPGCPLIQAYAAAVHFYSQSPAEIAARARPPLELALARRAQVTRREQLLIDALAYWAGGDYGATLARLERLTAEWPTDLVAAKLAEFVFFLAPDYARHLRFMEPLAPANARSSAFGAMHSFALELCGQHERAEAVARASMALDPQTPWAHHTLAHVYLAQGRAREGAAELTALAPRWSAHSPSMQVHNAWHLALLHLAELDVAGALRLFRERVWGTNPASPVEQEDAVSLLWRVELAGGAVGDAWAELAPHVAPRAAEPVTPFLSAHCVYALARAGQLAAAREALAGVERHALQQSGPARFVWADVGVPLVRACLAFARGDADAAVAHLEPVAWDLPCVGGSDAQNDVFAQTLLVALIRAGQRADARRLLAGRIGPRAPTPLETHWLESVGCVG